MGEKLAHHADTKGKIAMISNTSQPLVGERWPAADIAEPAQNGNNYAVMCPVGNPARAGSCREKHEQAGTVSTKLARRSEFRSRAVPPLAIDLFCGLGGWTDGLLAEGYNVIGFDIERHEYGDHRYPGMLAIQDVTTLHGSQFKGAALIVASPPCQEYSYMAMPWKLAKAKAAAIRADKTGKKLEELNRLFNACFRIQREACEAAGRHVPMVVENVRGAIPWVGRSRWNFGSFHLWGDVPALMPFTFNAIKVPSFRFDGSGRSFQTASVRRTDPGKGRFTSRDCGVEGRKNGGDWFGSGENASLQRRHGSKSSGRRMAAAMIAKIPLPLSQHIAVTFRPSPPLETGGGK